MGNPSLDIIAPSIHAMDAAIPGNREAMGLFDNPEALQAAIRELEGTAFPRDSLSILGHRTAIEDRFGQAAVHPDFIEDDPHAPREAPVRPEEQTIGAGILVGCATYIGAVSAGIVLGPATIPVTLMAIILGGGSGAALGAALLARLKYKHDEHIQEQLSRGGLLLWVRTADAEREKLACDILTRHGATHVRVHDIP